MVPRKSSAKSSAQNRASESLLINHGLRQCLSNPINSKYILLCIGVDHCRWVPSLSGNRCRNKKPSYRYDARITDRPALPHNRLGLSSN